MYTKNPTYLQGGACDTAGDASLDGGQGQVRDVRRQLHGDPGEGHRGGRPELAHQALRQWLGVQSHGHPVHDHRH